MQENKLANLREMLLQSPTSNLWWECIQLVESAEDKGEKELLRSYLSDHASRDESWSLCRVPCGDWETEHPGWQLCEVTQKKVKSLPKTYEVHCPPGRYMRGCSPGDEEAYDDEKPRHEVILSRGFWAFATPITQAAFAAVDELRTFAFRGKQRPVETINWFEAMHFCNQLSEKLDLEPVYSFSEGYEKWIEDQTGTTPEVSWNPEANGYRLPTEAEWEYMCRAGSIDAMYGPLDEIAWYDENSRRTHKVAEKMPNAWGFFDTLGNVWEWCFDTMNAYAYKKPLVVDPLNLLPPSWEEAEEFEDPEDFEDGDSSQKLARGGCWAYSSGGTRASFRVSRESWYRSNYIGFRPVRTQF